MTVGIPVCVFSPDKKEFLGVGIVKKVQVMQVVLDNMPNPLVARQLCPVEIEMPDGVIISAGAVMRWHYPM